ncbi:hypothetical protein OSTOST_02044, partial [Ostertagia ostertagi]
SQSLAFKPDGDKIATSQAYRLAKKILDAETTKDKRVAVFTDGQSSTCDIPETEDKDELSVVDKMRKNGTNMVMVPTGPPANGTNMTDFVDDPSNVLDTKQGRDVTAKPDSDEAREMQNRLLDALTKPLELEHATVPHEETAEPETGNSVAGFDRTTPENNDRNMVTPPLGMDHVTSRPDAVRSGLAFNIHIEVLQK